MKVISIDVGIKNLSYVILKDAKILDWSILNIEPKKNESLCETMVYFFQTNTYQAKVLYDAVVEFAGLKGTENVYDLYTGIGSIALYVAQACRQVVGIEEIPEAIADAEVNARLTILRMRCFTQGMLRTY